MKLIVDTIKSNDIELFTKLVRQYPPELHGFNLLHETIARGRKEMSEILLQAAPGLIYGSDFPYENTPLMYAISSSSIDMIQLFDKYEAYSITNSSGNLPLHYAISCTKDYDIIRHVYKKFPEALNIANNSGQYPLHIACQHGCSLEIVKMLYTGEQDVQDVFGNYPLHLFGEYTSDDKYAKYNKETIPENSGVISYMNKKNPGVILKQNSSGNTPVHNFAMLYAPKTSVLFSDVCSLLCPEALLIKNHQGMLPVHIASFYHDVDMTIAMLAICPATMYENSKAYDNIFEMWDLAGSLNVCSLVSFILSLKFAPRDSLWKFIPKPLPFFEKYLHEVLPEHREKCVGYLTKKAKTRLQNQMTAFNAYITRNNINIEKDIVDVIILHSI
ncbi:ankyrin repeat-containing protein [Paramecium bursaria Chlorella virus CVM-1]|uniref:Ankyrin repeat-containing protein n=1 Tax=Paramecium bursaria Chlorella virus CVA-1 TaxID=42683 RepID=M1HFR1_9PHYC|nr:ankyrin repeat-containing protein [Paramecium bursaria Chlorella virus CVA-1]AGE48958.1 ankyrin repeat-containing protein [Paramecium bursaria Chlorella virus AP110A]AGE50642.1 ankyrin repeat-containing protein [Paramecium bursaria Chlorella virus CVA-1]AGE51983.1 ankyrin repeat-containing protein [Paramecium bursaria Chlorella virus CVM-1]AGE52320.1 ankyrin repeat-containing protein [Paramecium bursaria Chlorella virus CVR-1]